METLAFFESFCLFVLNKQFINSQILRVLAKPVVNGRMVKGVLLEKKKFPVFVDCSCVVKGTSLQQFGFSR